MQVTRQCWRVDLVIMVASARGLEVSGKVGQEKPYEQSQVTILTFRAWST